MSSILLFGASGAVGRFLLPRLSPAHQVVPVSRTASVQVPGWLKADLNNADVNWPTAEAAISLGPLDAFAQWLERRRDPALRRIIALSSMSAVSKSESDDPAERDLAARLIAAEQRLRDVGAQRGIAVTLFRPTLIYGAGIDRSLAPIARFAQRWRVLPIPIGATGLRQPVHARDLAAACASALENSATHDITYELGGGERLAFEEMIRRLRRCVTGPVVSLPIPIAALHAAAIFSARGMPGRAAIARLRQSLTADNSAALRDFGYAPGPFDAAGVLPP